MAIRHDPNNANAWYNLGVIVDVFGNYRDGVNAFSQAADIDKDFTNAWFNKVCHLHISVRTRSDQGVRASPPDRSPGSGGTQPAG